MKRFMHLLLLILFCLPVQKSLAMTLEERQKFHYACELQKELNCQTTVTLEVLLIGWLRFKTHYTDKKSNASLYGFECVRYIMEPSQFRCKLIEDNGPLEFQKKTLE